MKTKKYKYLLFSLVVLPFAMSSCYNDLNTTPIDPDEKTSDVVFSDETAYDNFIAKIYAGLSVTGNQGPAGQPDVVGIDEGSQASYLRMLWNMEELPTEEAVCCWNDQTIGNFHGLSWTSSDVFIRGFYYRLYYQITLASEFLRESTEAKLNSRGVSAEGKAKIKQYRAEARFLRALSYYHVLDHFRQGPFVTEDSEIGSVPPPAATTQELFNYIESELLAINDDLLDPVAGFSANYGRANKAAAWTLLAKLYLNAKTYTGTEKYTECISECAKVIGEGYELEPKYADLFKADNYNSKEIIFPMIFEKDYIQTYGGMQFLMNSAVNADLKAMIAAPGSWAGNRATVNVLDRFDGVEQNDQRCSLLYTGYNKTDMTEVGEFKEGVQVLKFSNFDSKGVDTGGSYPNTDFPLFRLADVYLMYAEAVLRGGTGGSITNALNYVNLIRDRAYVVDAAGKVAQADLTLDFILDERGRELLWEAQRRSDLVRFDKLTTSSYLWDFKGGVLNGAAVDSKFNVFPIPAADINANPNLVQNTGY